MTCVFFVLFCFCVLYFRNPFLYVPSICSNSLSFPVQTTLSVPEYKPCTSYTQVLFLESVPAPSFKNSSGYKKFAPSPSLQRNLDSYLFTPKTQKVVLKKQAVKTARKEKTGF